MQLRSIAVRLVLATAALTTVATSAPEDIVLSATGNGTLDPGPARITIVANRAAVNHAEFVRLVITPAVPMEALDPAPLNADDGTVPSELEYSVEQLCQRDRDCEASVTFEVLGDEPIDVSVTATFIRPGDGALLFPDNPAFPDSATVEVRIEP